MIAVYVEPMTQWQIYGRRRDGRLYLTPEAKALKRAIALGIAVSPDGRDWRRIESRWLKLTLRLYWDRWLTKAGEPRKIDATNMVKLIEDAVVDATGIDDSRFSAVLIEKAICEPRRNRIVIDLDAIEIYGEV